MPRVSILIPTLDAEEDLARLLPALSAQEVEGGFDVSVVDSSSSDRTREILADAGIAVRRIERSEFRHGETRNLLAGDAKGELLVFLSQDVVPEGPGFVEALVGPLGDERVAGSTARILPHEDDDPLTARTVLDSPEASDEPAIRELESAEGFAHLSARERAAYLSFNNVASCIRASVWREIPFPDVPFGEDFAWAARALTAGWKLAFAADAVVHHAHRYTPSQAFERYRIDAAFHRRVHGHRVRPSLFSVLRGILYEVREDARFVRRRRAGLRHLLRSPGLRSAQVLGQYFGSRGWRGGGGDEATRRYA